MNDEMMIPSNWTEVNSRKYKCTYAGVNPECDKIVERQIKRPYYVCWACKAKMNKERARTKKI